MFLTVFGYDLGTVFRTQRMSKRSLVSIESVVETTLKLTFLHHSALKAPRLPMPIIE
jgi:hypothetical protein